MGLPGVYLTNAAVTAAVGVGIIMWWVASRRRIATETIQRAQSEADRLARQAERDAETLKKEVLLSAREKAHELASDAERQARERLKEIGSLEQALADKTRTLADRLAIIDRQEQDLRGREKAIRQLEQSGAAGPLYGLHP